jgi:ABC-2 type transport system ATP-binding protein
MLEAVPATLSVRELTKRYGTVNAVQGVSFDLTAGEIFGLLGPNGAGKTTTLECILGLRRPDSGAIMVEGIDALAEPARARRLVGAVLQSTALQDKITPRQALRFFGAFQKPRPDVDALLTRFALTEKADATFDTLSGGQRQRLALALAFVHEPRLLVLDEPTTGLDPQARRELHTLIAERRAAGCTVVLSTHQLDEAERLCDRVAIIDAGQIVAIGRPDELIARAGGTARVTVAAAHAIDITRLERLAGVTAVAARREGWQLTTTDVNRTILELTQLLAREGNELRDLQVQRPALEDAFLQLTGRAWRSAAPDVAA